MSNDGGISAIKQKLREDRPVLGTWAIVNSPVVTEILGIAGFDFQLLDLEHGLWDMGTLDNGVRACEATGCAPIVRVSGINPPEIQNVLDLGVHGLIIPQVLNAKRAREAVAAMHYAPAGTRGYNPFTRAALYRNPPNNQSGKLKHDFLLSAVIIENLSGYDELDEIIAIEDLDVIYLGIYDMSIALGCNGDTTAPKVNAFVDDAAKRIRAGGKTVGMMVRSEADIDAALVLGARFLVWGVDSFLIHQAAKTATTALESAAKRFANG